MLTEFSREGYKFKNKDRLYQVIAMLQSDEHFSTRVHNSNYLGHSKSDFKLNFNQESKATMKPNGFWYAFGAEWIEWCESEMPHWIGRYLYKVKVNESKVLSSFPDDLNRKFGPDYEGDSDAWGMKAGIHWDKIADKGYSGVEIPGYDWNARRDYLWYYGWDVASGCIWNANGVRNIDLLVDLDEVP